MAKKKTIAEMKEEIAKQMEQLEKAEQEENKAVEETPQQDYDKVLKVIMITGFINTILIIGWLALLFIL